MARRTRIHRCRRYNSRHVSERLLFGGRFRFLTPVFLNGADSERKAVGIRKEYILWQFLSEAAALTFFGGVMGIFLGWLASLLITQLTGLATVISLSSIFLAFGVSAGVGIVFGFYPARRAANLIPMEALRYE